MEQAKTFNYNGHEFRLIENTLLLKREGGRVFPRLTNIYNRKIQEEGLDLIPVKKYQDQITFYKKVIGTIIINDTMSTKVKKEKKADIKRHEQTIEKIEQDLLNDPVAQARLVEQTNYNVFAIDELTAEVLYVEERFKRGMTHQEIIEEWWKLNDIKDDEEKANNKLIKPFLSKVLQGDFTKLNFGDNEIFQFIQSIVLHFFLSFNRNSLK